MPPFPPPASSPVWLQVRQIGSAAALAVIHSPVSAGQIQHPQRQPIVQPDPSRHPAAAPPGYTRYPARESTPRTPSSRRESPARVPVLDSPAPASRGRANDQPVQPGLPSGHSARQAPSAPVRCQSGCLCRRDGQERAPRVRRAAGSHGADPPGDCAGAAVPCGRQASAAERALLATMRLDRFHPRSACQPWSGSPLGLCVV